MSKSTGINPEVFKALGFANGNDNAIVDGGTARFKGAKDSGGKNDKAAHVEHFTHAYAEIDEPTFDELCYRYEGKNAFHFFKANGKYYVVGDEAFSYRPNFEPLRGRLKYTPEYYGVMFAAMVLRLYNGNPPERLNAFLGHPPADRPHTRELMKSVYGQWNIITLQGKPSFKVEYVNIFDEIVGGAMNAQLDITGQAHKDVDLSGKTLIFDLGGGTLDLAYMIDGQMDYNTTMESIRIGANEAVENFKRAFDSRYRDLVTAYEGGLPHVMVHDVFMKNDHMLELAAGEMLDCSKLYEQAVNPVLKIAKDEVKRYAGNLLGVRRVLVTGGAAGLLYDEICERIFPEFAKRGAIRVADFMGDLVQPTAQVRRELLTANARGARKMLEVLKIMQAENAAKLAKGANNGRQKQR